MERYLMMIYVSLEQEKAMKKLFLDNGWKYQKPDLLKVTDQVGPLVESCVLEEQITADDDHSVLDVVVSPDKDDGHKSRRKQKMSVRTDPTESSLSSVIIKEEVCVGDADLAEYMDFGDEDDDFVDNPDIHLDKRKKRRKIAKGRKSRDGSEDVLAKLDGTQDDSKMSDGEQNNTDDERNESSTARSKNKFSESDHLREEKSPKMANVLFYQCGICKVKYNHKDELNKHLEQEACKSNLNKTGRQDMASSSVETGSSVSVSADKLFDMKDEDDTLEVVENPENINSEVGSSAAVKKYTCDQLKCDMAFTTAYSLETHQRVRHNLTFDDPVECNFCLRSFGSEHILNLHRQDEHVLMDFSKRVECDDCLEVCANFPTFAAHKRKIHGTLVCLKPNKNHVCEICGNGFSRLDTLKAHRDIIHLGVKKRKAAPRPSERKHVCNVCGKAFLRRNNLSEHVRVKHNNNARKYICEECGEAFLRPFALESHTNKVHLNQKPYECEKCHKKYVSAVKLRQHKDYCMKNEEDKLECEYCGKKFAHKNNLTMHLEAIHSKTPPTCECGAVIKWRSSMAKHRRKCPLRQPALNEATTSGQQTRKVRQSKTTGVAGLELTDSLMSTSDSSNIVAANHGFTTISTDSGVQVVSTEVAQALRDQGLLVDGAMGGTLRMTDTKNNLDDDPHVQSIEEIGGSLQIDESDSWYLAQTGTCLSVHSLRQERPVKMNVAEASSEFECDKCGRRYNNKSSLKRHGKSHQPGVQQCGACNMFFDDTDLLQAHKEKYHHATILCGICGMAMARRTCLRKHMMRAHPEKCSSKFRCTFPHCRAVFDSEDLYQDHINIHKGVKPHCCKVCSKPFSTKLSLRTHEIRHDKLKNLGTQCDDCGKVFTGSGALHNHVMSVHKQKRYKCDFCDKVFMYRSGYSKHLHNHKKQDSNNRSEQKSDSVVSDAVNKNNSCDVENKAEIVSVMGKNVTHCTGTNTAESIVTANSTLNPEGGDSGELDKELNPRPATSFGERNINQVMENAVVGSSGYSLTETGDRVIAPVRSSSSLVYTVAETGQLTVGGSLPLHNVHLNANGSMIWMYKSQ